jgi:hypothetical protein
MMWAMEGLWCHGRAVQFPLSVSLSFEGFEIGREGEMLAYDILWRKLIERIDAFVFLFDSAPPDLVWV